MFQRKVVFSLFSCTVTVIMRQTCSVKLKLWLHCTILIRIYTIILYFAYLLFHLKYFCLSTFVLCLILRVLPDLQQ